VTVTDLMPLRVGPFLMRPPCGVSFTLVAEGGPAEVEVSSIRSAPCALIDPTYNFVATNIIRHPAGGGIILMPEYPSKVRETLY
jgi:hypothetical protein